MDELKQQIAEFEKQEEDIQWRLNTAETDEEARQITNDLNLVRNRLSEKREELRIAEEKEQVRAEEIEQRTQAQEEHNGGLKEAIRQIFGAVCPSNLAEVVGLTEYGEMVQTFNALVEEAVNENNSALYAMISQQIETKDAKIQELTTANIGLSADAQEANARVEQLERHLVKANESYDELNDKYRGLLQVHQEIKESNDDKQREIEGLKSVIKTKDEEINRLREELSKAPAPRREIAPYKPSDTLQNRIAASGNQIKSALELALEGNRFRGKISAIEPPAIDSAEPVETVAQDDRISIAETAATVEPPQFQKDDTVQGEHTMDGALAPEAVGEAETFEQWATREINALKAAVFGEGNQAA